MVAAISMVIKIKSTYSLFTGTVAAIADRTKMTDNDREAMISMSMLAPVGMGMCMAKMVDRLAKAQDSVTRSCHGKQVSLKTIQRGIE